MLSHIRASRWSKAWCVGMAMHIFNFCADAPDVGPPRSPENLAYNDIESVLELVLEHGMNIENAIPEQEDPNCPQPEGNPTLKLTSFLLPSALQPALWASFRSCLRPLPPLGASLLPLIAAEVVKPPPENA